MTLDGRRKGERAGAWVLNVDLLCSIGQCLHLVGRHAAENCGAWGDAVVAACLVGADMSLAYNHQIGGYISAEQIDGAHVLSGPVISRHTVVIEALARVGPPLLEATSLVATDLFHAFGSPEVRHIGPGGVLRMGWFPGAQAQARAWAEQHGIPVE